jgi:hypothetical protein
MMWLFNIKTDGTHKARLVVRGDQMIPYIDFDPNAVYCGNVSACSTKIAAKIAATYQLAKRDGAYLVTRTSPDFKWYIQTPHKYEITDSAGKEFIGVHFYRDDSFNYYMDQERMLDDKRT